MPTDLTKLREAWEQESHAEREGYPRDHIVASEAAIDDLARRAYEAGVADCLALVNAHELGEAVRLMHALRSASRGEKGGE